MKKDAKIRTSIWIDPRLLLLLNERGMTLSSFITRCLPMFLDLPDDPREKLIQEDLEKTVLRLRSTYEYEMRQIMKEKSQENVIRDSERQKEEELIIFGDYLKRTSAYPVFERCLKRKDYDDDTLQIVTDEINRMNGKTYKPSELWNRAITWFVKYGKAEVS